MKIGFDLDNVFINTPPFIPKTIITKLYMKKYNGTLVYRIPSRKEQLFRLAFHHPLFRPPIKKNLAVLKTIRKDEHLLYLISSRYDFLRSMTDRIIKKHQLDAVFRELFFNYENKQPHVFKNQIINNLKLDAFVDDDLYLLKYIAGKNNKIKLYWFNDKLNKRVAANIYAITNLQNIFK